jgi:formiminoglutamase
MLKCRYVVKRKCPFLISVPHGGIGIPEMVQPAVGLTQDKIRYYSDPDTQVLFGLKNRVEAYLDTPISRMIVDLNRPPLPLPPRDPDGIIKSLTPDGEKVYLPDKFPDMILIHKLLMEFYFPFHQRIDELIDRRPVTMAFDCHSMVPVGSPGQKDAGRPRPLICLGNNGDHRGNARKGSITTCPPEWIQVLAGIFRDEFTLGCEVAINNPFSGGFISNAHFWRKGVPWIQIEINRALYESGKGQTHYGEQGSKTLPELRERIWKVLTSFWDTVG